ncbi:MAG: hydrolase [Steroidobacteraceae bacterium]
MSSETRAAVVTEALSWIGTPYHHAQAVKGRGVDCAMSLIEWFANAGVIERFDPRPYAASWFLHRDQELFLRTLSRYAEPLPPGEEPLPADLALYRFGRCVAHGALVLDETFIVHACAIARRVERRERAAMAPRLSGYWRVRVLA